MAGRTIVCHSHSSASRQGKVKKRGLLPMNHINFAYTVFESSGFLERRIIALSMRNNHKDQQERCTRLLYEPMYIFPCIYLMVCNGRDCLKGCLRHAQKKGQTAKLNDEVYMTCENFATMSCSKC